MATRNGSAEWHGDLKSGDGTVTVGDDVWTGNYSFSSRFEDGAGTNPEELLAAAHAGCFTMALSLALSDAGHAPDDLRTTAKTTLRQVEGKRTITKIELETEGRVTGIDQGEFEDRKSTCLN